MDIKRIFELTNPLLKVRYYTGEEGPIRRCDIVQPPVPRRLEKDQDVTTLYEGQEYMASMLGPWNEPVVLALTGVDTKLTVLFDIDRSISRVLRSDIIPFPPADIALYSRSGSLQGKISRLHRTSVMAPGASHGQCSC